MVTVAVFAVACAPPLRPLEFFPLVGDEHFRCTSAWADLGANKVIAQPLDLRLLVSEVTLLSRSGEVSYTLEERSTQRGGLALVDFEAGDGTCKGGTGETVFQLQGTPERSGPFTGVRFRLGGGARVPPAASELVDDGRPRGLSLGLTTTATDRWLVHATGDCGEGPCSISASGFDPTVSVMYFDLRVLLESFTIDATGACAAGAPCPALERALGADQRVVTASPHLVGTIDHETHQGH